MKILINCTGFIGDILFSTSVAAKLKQEKKATVVDYLIHLYQPYELLCNDPNIDNVFMFDVDKSNYNKTITLHEIDFTYPPALYYQTIAGIEKPSPDYYIHTNPAYDYVVKKTLKAYKDANKVVVAYMRNWEERSFLYTEEEYKKGVDVPNLGYGGSHRNTEYIISQLMDDDDFVLVPIGMPPKYNARESDFSNTAEYSMQASFLKHCDYFIGAEGGLCNLAAGVGTTTIITGDFVHQLYGWNGVLRKIVQPKLGPVWYFPNKHHELDPFLKDDEVVDAIRSIIKSEK